DDLEAQPSRAGEGGRGLDELVHALDGHEPAREGDAQGQAPALLGLAAEALGVDGVLRDVDRLAAVARLYLRPGVARADDDRGGVFPRAAVARQPSVGAAHEAQPFTLRPANVAEAARPGQPSVQRAEDEGNARLPAAARDRAGGRGAQGRETVHEIELASSE